MVALPLPKFRPFQRAILAAKPPAGEGWIYELKYDGYRCQAAISGRQVRLFSRNGHDWTKKQFAFVVPEMQELTEGSLLIDGEIVAFDRHGNTSFSHLQAALGSGGPITFIAFDLLEQDGKDLSKTTLVRRKALLEAVIGERPRSSTVQYAAHLDATEHTPDVIFNAICEGGHEGIVAKRANSTYRAGPGKSWVKVKCTQRQEFVIIGWRGTEYGSGLRSLLVGSFEDGKLVYRGKVGAGLTVRMIDNLQRLLKPIALSGTRLEKVPKDAGRMPHWVKPVLVADVAFTEITPDGYLRHPSFKGLRDDKDAQEVSLELPAS